MHIFVVSFPLKTHIPILRLVRYYSAPEYPYHDSSKLDNKALLDLLYTFSVIPLIHQREWLIFSANITFKQIKGHPSSPLKPIIHLYKNTRQKGWELL